MVRPTPALAAAALSAVSSVVSADVNHATLEGMTVWGYQGWYTGNWKWFSPAEVIAGPPTGDQRVLTDYIPYVADYPEECREPTNFVLADGSTANWYYSNCSAVVEKHFQYMQKYKIDGVFVQRFDGAANPNDQYYEAGVQVLQWVRQYAEQYGKYFAVEYDYSGLKPSSDPSTYLSILKDDFTKTVKPLFDSPSYIYQDGKPVIEIYGGGFDNGGTGPQFQSLFDTMASTGVTPWKILGVPWTWQQQQPPANDPNQNWDLFQSVDCIQPWGVGSYNSASDFANYYKNALKTGKATADSLGIKFSPVIHAGTENSNAAFNKSSGVPKGAFGQGRANSTLLQYSLGNVTSADLKPHFVFGAMFDEYTEGSQILPALSWNELPPNPNPGFAGYDDGADPYVYLDIAGQWTAEFHRTWGQQPLSP
ncbi:hypothetical protein FH972_023728 [Carpinus fangiana]|uniref:GH26 domain-containing protein n=1 Tax=Carpinus fangiana TaxID=176857 RepID=A0A5N6KWT5_9ROSI|nr:hypothetical protein FH972_023728 [Carpinus fangiana]